MPENASYYGSTCSNTVPDDDDDVFTMMEVACKGGLAAAVQSHRLHVTDR